jgi:streptogramin lyase
MLTILDGPTHSTGKLTRREWLRVGSIGLGGLSLPALARLAAAESVVETGGTFRAHGHVCKNFRLYWPTAQLCFDRKLGREVLIVFDDAGSGTRLLVIDFETGRTTPYPFPHGGAAWHAKRAGDGTLWIGLNRIGQLAHFDPTERAYLPVARNLGGGKDFTHVCNLTEAADGAIYYATYKNCQLWRYDPKTDTHTLLVKRIDPKNNYPYGLTTATDGRIVIVTAANAHSVWVFDSTNNSITNLTPEKYRVPSNWSQPVAFDKWVLVDWLDPKPHAMEVHLYDLASDRFAEAIRFPNYTLGTGDNTNVMLTAEGRVVVKAALGDYRYLEIPSMNLSPAFRLEGAHHQMQIEPTRDGKRLLTGWGQEYSVVSTSGGWLAWQLPDTPATRVKILALSGHSDGKVYGTAGLGNTMFVFDPKSGETTNTGQITDTSGEAYGICSLNDRLYMASYTWAVITEYDPTRPWQVDQSRQSNPRTIGRLGSGQYRPVGGIHVAPGGLLVTGTAPNYGQSGGAFSLIDPKTDQVRVYRNRVPGGTVSEFATDGQRLFGYGGGEFFLWDVDKEKFLFRKRMPGGPLAFAGEKLYMVSDNGLASFDPSIMKMDRLAGVSLAGVPRHSLRVGKSGELYAISGGSLVRINLETGETVQFAATRAQAARCLTSTPDGTWWFVGRAGLCSFKEDSM